MELLKFFKDKIILVTGGTGSIGLEIVTQLSKYSPKTIRILSNSENELWETQIKFKDSLKKLRFLLGDIRDMERMRRATQNVDYIFNVAAIKHVPISEYNPLEAVNVNIHGLENIIEAAFINGVKKIIHISTDKAVNPTTVMGATKMLGERLCISREFTKGGYRTSISCVRFGNVLGSRGSIIPLIKKQIRDGVSVTLTNKKMSRFFLSISQAADLVLKSAFLAGGGEIFVLKMPTILIKDLLEVVIEEYCLKIGMDPNNVKITTIGTRLGEKLYEELISQIEFPYCYEIDDLFIIYPLTTFGYEMFSDTPRIGEKVRIDNGFNYNSKKNQPLSKEKIRTILKDYNLI